MTLGTSLFLVALGAILTFAVTDVVAGVELATVGLILMVVGAVGLAISLLWANARRGHGETAVVRDRYVERDRVV